MRARAFATLLSFSCMLAACASMPAPTTITPGQALVLQPGERVALPDGAMLRYLRVAADSRCRPDVQCIRAGDADVAFAFIPPDGVAQSVTVNIPESPSAPIGDWQLRLLALTFDDAPRATIRIEAATP